jgi:uncharacterized protein
MSNLETVKQMYVDFKNGHIPPILEQLSDSVEWEYGVNFGSIPWLQPRRGRQEVAKFFEALNQLEFHKFEPKTFFESGNIVVCLFDVDARVKDTENRIMEEDEVHIWYFNEQGKVVKFRHRADTHQHWLALHREPVREAIIG